jgi:hypothetical protein
MTPGNTQRLAEIDSRNALRRDAGLPLLCPSVELRRMHQAEAEAEFESFVAIHESAVMEHLLKPWREQLGAERKPSFMIGTAIANECRKQLRAMMLRRS